MYADLREEERRVKIPSEQSEHHDIVVMCDGCKACGGNDKNIPCAYPSENKDGCLRDFRLPVSKHLSSEEISLK